MAEVATSFGWSFDATARVMLIPSWWRWNPPDHEKVLQGNLKDLHEVPPCGLVDAFVTNLQYLKPELHGAFVEACRGALPRAQGSQYQDQVAGTETGSRAARGKAAGAARLPLPAESNEKTKKDDDPVATSKLLADARETLKLTDPDAAMEHLLDALHSVSSLKFSKPEGISALNEALTERRLRFRTKS